MTGIPASYLLDRFRMRGSSSLATAQAIVPLLRRITEVTGDAHLGVLASVLRLVDPGEAETLLRRVYD